jgi:prephenate dehydrogenase
MGKQVVLAFALVTPTNPTNPLLLAHILVCARTYIVQDIHDSISSHIQHIPHLQHVQHVHQCPRYPPTTGRKWPSLSYRALKKV